MRPPPHSAELFKLRCIGKVPVPGPYGHVAVLTDWQIEVAGAFVIAPHGVDPLDLDFSFAAGLDVTLFIAERCPYFQVYKTLEYLFEQDQLDLIAAIMAGKPASVRVVDLSQAHLGLGRATVAIFGKARDA